MDIENAVGKRLDERRAQQAHEAREADERHAALLQRRDDGKIERLARRVALVVDVQRLDAGRAGALEAGRVRPVGDDHGNLRVQAAAGDAVDDRLQIAAAARYENANPSILHGYLYP